MIILKTKDIINTSDNIIIKSSSDLDISIDAGNFTLQHYTPNGYEDVTITSATVNGNICTIIPTVLTTGIYTLTAFQIRSDVLDNLIKFQSFRFLVIDVIKPPNTNNVYNQLTEIDNLLSTEYLLEKQNEFTLNFNPSSYNNDKKSYVNSDELITIKNNETILNLLINQYFSEYKVFYDDINHRDLLKTPKGLIYDNDYVNNLHKVFLNNIPKWLALKGNKSFIEIMIALYSKYLGYNLISVVEDPTHNFEYRISSSISKDIWNKSIKPYVHPMGWKVIYNEITSNVNGFYFQQIDKKRLMREQWNLDCTSFLDAQMFSKTYIPHYIKLRNLYHSSGNIEDHNVLTHEHLNHRNCTLQNVHDEYKLGMNLNGFNNGSMKYVTSLGSFSSSALNKELKDLGNIKYHIDRFNKNIIIDYGFPGVANEYIFEQYLGNTLLTSTESLLTKVTIPNDNHTITVMGLKKGKWFQKINKIDDSAFIQYKTLNASFKFNNIKNKFLNVRNDSKAYRFNGLSVDSFTSEYNNTSLAYVNDFTTYPTSAISTYDVSGNLQTIPSTASIDGITYYNSTFKFTKPGIITKYEWKLYINSILVENKTTYHNNTNFVIKGSNYTSSNVTLKIYYKNGSYSLVNKFICA